MPSRVQNIHHFFRGGWATDFGNLTQNKVSPEGTIEIPYLLEASNVVYEFDGGPRKVGGTAKLNASAVGGPSNITGMFDYWRQGTGGSPVQHRILHQGTVCMRDNNADGVFTNLITGLTSGAIPSYATFDDLLIVMSTDDAPQKWDTVGAAAALGTNTPNGSFGVTHRNRFWIAGVDANPSRLYYSQDVVLSGPDGDWNSTGAGYIDISPGDGDGIRGLVSHKGDLWIFKGPYAGSIYRITGSSPVGPDPFALVNHTRGVACVAHNAIFQFRDDVGFLDSTGQVHSLNATDRFGDFSEVALSRPIHSWITDRVNKSVLNTAWAAADPFLGRVMIALAIDSDTTPTVLLSMDYRFEPTRWSLVNLLTNASGTDQHASCVAHIVDTGGSNRGGLMAGCRDGFVRKLDQETRAVDGSGAISSFFSTPFFDYGSPRKLKNLYDMSLSVSPKSSSTLTVGYNLDSTGLRTGTVTQTQGAALDTFILDTDILGGTIQQELNLVTEGEFRYVQFTVQQTGASEDFEVHGMSASVKLGADSLEN